MSDAETIQYAEPYRDNCIKKDEIYRKKAKQKAIQTLIRKKKVDNALFTNTTGTIDDDNVDIDFKIEAAADENDDVRSDDDVVYVSYVPPPAAPPIHPRERLRRRTKEISEQKEKDRKEKAKKRAQKENFRRKAEENAIRSLNNRLNKKIQALSLLCIQEQEND